MTTTLPPRAHERLADDLDRAETARRASSRAFAAQLAAVHDVLAEAAQTPELFVTETFRGARRDLREFAQRVAAADLAVRLRLAEGTVLRQGERAEVLVRHLPGIWRGLVDGRIPPENAAAAADTARTLPAETRAAFDDAAGGWAERLAPARFRARARGIREQLHPEPLADRHRRAMRERDVRIEDDHDGMCVLTARLSGWDGHRIRAILTARARVARRHDGRTLAQAGADVLVERLLARWGTPGARESGDPAVAVAVAVTIPVTTLAGGDEPATLDGRVPVDAATARRIAAGAPSLARILTHPVTSAILDIDRRSYRIPADLRRWLVARDVTCTFPGCSHPARSCDLDHRVAWDDGGTTSADNLAHLCRHHHRLKHESRWRVEGDAGGITTWVSPTGHQHRTIRSTPPDAPRSP